MGGQGHECGDDVMAAKRKQPSTEAVQDNPEAKEIGPGIELETLRLLGSHVRGGTDDGADLGQGLLTGGGAGEAEIENLDAKERRRE